MRKSTRTLLALTAAVSFTAAACGSDSNDAVDDAVETADSVMTETTDAMAEPTDAMTETTDAMTETTDAMAETTDAMAETTDAMSEGEALAPSGPLCSAVPEEGAGSFAGMTEEPAATAASANPALSTLVTAVTEADLVDTLNGEGPFTIFAPANPAFEAIPPADLDALLADKETLTTALTYHVVQGEKLSSEDLASMDSVDTIAGTVMLSEEGGTLTLNDGQATVGCADVQTSNAVVHIIDGVLMP